MLKVGDRVRQVRDAYWRGITGVYDGRRRNDDGYEWDYFTPDAEAKFADGSSHSYAGHSCGMHVGSFEPIPATPTIPADIAERAIALVRSIVDHGNGYAPTLDTARSILADLEPVSVDEVAAREVAKQAGWADAVVESCLGCLIAAIAKGRELEREER